MTVYAATGHRPNRLGGYGEANLDKLYRFALVSIRPLPVGRMISGMALGWDQAVAKACVHYGIPWTAAIPFEGQDSKWPAYARDAYLDLLAKAAEVVYVGTPGYSPAKMETRNRWMVDHATHVLALWSGSAGGTANCIAYAKRMGKVIVPLWEKWSKFR